jgi:hypothetical protein
MKFQPLQLERRPEPLRCDSAAIAQACAFPRSQDADFYRFFLPAGFVRQRNRKRGRRSPMPRTQLPCAWRNALHSSEGSWIEVTEGSDMRRPERHHGKRVETSRV